MTKYEWEHELKKNIHRLPSDEIARVLDYYNEMFEDNIERGKSEREIIREFGNPVDVADKILSEYDGELLPVDVPLEAQKSNKSTATESHIRDVIFDENKDSTHEPDENKNAAGVKPEQKASDGNRSEDLSETDKRNIKVTLFVVFNVVTGFALVIAAAVLWIVLASFTVAGVGMGVGGVYAAIVSFGPMLTGALGSGLAQLGIGIACVGLGVLFVVCCVRLIRLYAQVTKKIFNGIFNVSKKERA